MKWRAILVFAGLSLNTSHAGQYFYWADFSSPLNQPNQRPTTNAGPRTPSRILVGNPTVVTSFGHLTNQPLMFKAVYYEQIGFDLPQGMTNYFIDFDFETHRLNSSLFAFDLWCCYPSFYLHGRDYIGVPPANSPYLPGWTDDELHHVRIDVDVPSATWRFQLDDRAPATGFLDLNTQLPSIRLNLSAWRAFTPDDPGVQVAIDDVRIGSLTPAPPPIITCSASVIRRCTNSTVTLNVNVVDMSTNPLKIIWRVDGASYQTNTLPEGAALTPTDLTFTANFGLGEHMVLVSAANGEATPAFCSTTVTVLDTTAPTISQVSARPDVLWPPNGRFVPVRIGVHAEDDCGSTACRIVEVHSNEPGGDWQITDDLTLNLRAKRAEKAQDRVYTVLVECEDASKNTSLRSVDVVVPHDRSNKTKLIIP